MGPVQKIQDKANSARSASSTLILHGAFTELGFYRAGRAAVLPQQPPLPGRALGGQGAAQGGLQLGAGVFFLLVFCLFFPPRWHSRSGSSAYPAPSCPWLCGALSGSASSSSRNASCIVSALTRRFKASPAPSRPAGRPPSFLPPPPSPGRAPEPAPSPQPQPQPPAAGGAGFVPGGAGAAPPALFAARRKEREEGGRQGRHRSPPGRAGAPLPEPPRRRPPAAG